MPEPLPSWRPPADLASIVERHTTLTDVIAFCHVPAAEPIDLAALAAAGEATDRWSRAGQPTVYLATDAGVVLAELGRHERGDRGAPVARRVLRLDLGAIRVLDLRTPAVLAELDLTGAPLAFMDRDVARAVACAVRATGMCDGIRVPSMALLDTPERHCIVVFADVIAGGFPSRIVASAVVGEVRAGG